MPAPQVKDLCLIHWGIPSPWTFEEKIDGIWEAGKEGPGSRGLEGQDEVHEFDSKYKWKVTKSF